MSTQPLPEDALDFLDHEPRRVIRDMLKAVVEHPEIYVNGFSISRAEGATYRYFLGKRGGLDGPFLNNRQLSDNVMGLLEFHGIAGPKINPQWADKFRSFTDAALEWHRTYGRGPDEIRKRIGRFFRAQGRDAKFYEFNAEEVAAKVGSTPEQATEQFELLRSMELIEHRRMGDGKIGVSGLSKPTGVLWAEQGYPPVHTLGSQPIDVTINLHLEIRNIIDQAQATDLPQETKDRFELLLHRAEEELAKPSGQGKFQRVKDLVEFTANIRQLLPDVSRLIAEHSDKVQQMIDATM